jgi:hypothetical protein
MGKTNFPRHFLVAYNEEGQLIDFGLYYSERMAKRAFDIAQEQSSDGHHKIKYDDGSYWWIKGPLNFKRGMISDYNPITSGRLSFLGMPDDQIRMMSDEGSGYVPYAVLKSAASYEREYFNNLGDARWNAFKRKFLKF